MLFFFLQDQAQAKEVQNSQQCTQVHPLGVMAEVHAAPSPSSAFDNQSLSLRVSQEAETLWEKELIPEKASIQKKKQLSKGQNPRRQKPCWLQGNREGLLRLWCNKCHLEKQSPGALSWVAEAGGRESPEQQDRALHPDLPRWQKGACFWELSLATGLRCI